MANVSVGTIGATVEGGIISGGGVLSMLIVETGTETGIVTEISGGEGGMVLDICTGGGVTDAVGITITEIVGVCTAGVETTAVLVMGAIKVVEVGIGAGMEELVGMPPLGTSGPENAVPGGA